MQEKHTKRSAPKPFKAKLKHYHRTASPELYAKKQKRWEDVSAGEFSDSSVKHTTNEPKLSVRLKSPKPAADGE